MIYFALIFLLFCFVCIKFIRNESPKCECNINKYDLNDINNHYIMRLPYPKHPFHAHSWFHMGEHYLAHGNKEIYNKYFKHNNYTVNNNDDFSRITLRIIAWSDEFIELTNKMTLFMFLLSFTNGNIGKIELFPPTTTTTSWPL